MIAGKQIEEVDEFRYFGSKKGGTEEDIQARIANAKHVLGLLRPIWRSASLTTRTKLKVFGSNVKAVCLYDAEIYN